MPLQGESEGGVGCCGSRKRSAAAAVASFAANVAGRLVEADVFPDDGLGALGCHEPQHNCSTDFLEGGVTAAMSDSRSCTTRIPCRQNARGPWLVYHRGYRWSPYAERDCALLVLQPASC